jgi:hypothetical protein
MTDSTGFMLLSKVYGTRNNRRIERGVLAGSETPHTRSFYGDGERSATIGNPVWDSLRRAKQGCLKCREWDAVLGGCHMGRMAGECER